LNRHNVAKLDSGTSNQWTLGGRGNRKDYLARGKKEAVALAFLTIPIKKLRESPPVFGVVKKQKETKKKSRHRRDPGSGKNEREGFKNLSEKRLRMVERNKKKSLNKLARKERLHCFIGKNLGKTKKKHRNGQGLVKNGEIAPKPLKGGEKSICRQEQPSSTSRGSKVIRGVYQKRSSTS